MLVMIHAIQLASFLGYCTLQVLHKIHGACNLSQDIILILLSSKQ
jgi:Na+-transporting NADH:ubiquinone oxidoreductase subunit NqrE